MRRLLAAFLLISGAAFAQPPLQVYGPGPTVPVGTPGNIASFGAGGVAGDNTTYGAEFNLQNNASGLNVFHITNTSSSGFSVMAARSVDTVYPSTGMSPAGDYEHFAVGNGARLSLQGESGYNFAESSRYDTKHNPLMPPTRFVLQQTGGLPINGTTYVNAVLTAGQATATLHGGGNWPSGINGMTVRSDTGNGGNGAFPVGTTVVSGAGTATVTFSQNALISNLYVPLQMFTPVYCQASSVILQETGPIDFYPWATSCSNVTGVSNPFMRLDRANARVSIGATNGAMPIGTLDVIGQGWFGNVTGPSRDTTYANAALNIIDSGTAGFSWLKIGVNTFKWQWNASPSRLDFVEGNGSTVPLSLYMDGTATAVLGGPVKVGSSAQWTVATNCGSLTNSTKCLSITDPNGNIMYIPAYGTY